MPIESRIIHPVEIEKVEVPVIKYRRKCKFLGIHFPQWSKWNDPERIGRVIVQRKVCNVCSLQKSHIVVSLGGR